jgi:flagellar basal body-associated protein FliL
MKTQYSKKKILKLAGVTTLALALGIGAASAFASSDSGKTTQEKIQALLNKLQTASQQEQETGQLVDTPHGKVFAGDSAQKMEKLHDETQAQIDALIARPENERQKAVTEIKKFADKQDLAVNYKNTAKSVYNPGVLEEVYTTDYDQYEIDVRNNKIIQFGPRPLNIGEKAKDFDTTARYSKEELETMARQFIAKNMPEVKLNDLTSKFGDKEGVNYFFRWEDTSREIEDMHPFIQVGFSRGGDLLSYTNSLGL